MVHDLLVQKLSAALTIPKETSDDLIFSFPAQKVHANGMIVSKRTIKVLNYVSPGYRLVKCSSSFFSPFQRELGAFKLQRVDV